MQSNEMDNLQKQKQKQKSYQDKWVTVAWTNMEPRCLQIHLIGRKFWLEGNVP